MSLLVTQAYNGVIQYKRLTFIEYARTLPSALVLDRFMPGKSAGRRIVSSSMLADAVAAFLKPSTLTAAFDALSERARDACAWAYLFGPQGIPATPVNGFEDELLSSLLVCAMRTPDGTTFYRGFTDCEAGLADHIVRHLRARGKPRTPRQSSMVWPWRSLSDCTMILSLASQGALKLMKSGALNKASLTLVRAVMHGTRSPLRTDQYKTVALLMDYMERNGLIYQADGEVVENRPRVLQWLCAGYRESYRDLHDFCITDGMGCNWTLLRRVLESPRDGWCDESIVDHSLAPRLKDALRVGEFLGLIETAKEHDATIFGLAGENPLTVGAPAADGTTRITVLPDFTTVIAAEVEPAQLYWFSCIGDITSLDHVYKGHINKERVSGALASGTEGDALLEYLSRWNAPANVVESVREWVREFSRVSVMPESVVVSADQRVTSLISSFEPLQRLVTVMPAHAVFRIRPGREKEVAEVLRSLGFDPRTPALAERRRTEPAGLDDAVKREDAEVVTDFKPVTPAAAAPLRNSKYNSVMRVRDATEMVQLIDYAILMGNRLKFEYEGSTSVRKGTYTVTPVLCPRGRDMILDADDENGGTRRKFMVQHIGRIGVEQ